jgi:hypothetical protein
MSIAQNEAMMTCSASRLRRSRITTSLPRSAWRSHAPPPSKSFWQPLDRNGAGSFELLWRNERSEAWLNLWWEPRDTGFHDHGGSCVGVHVLEGRALSEALVVGGPRRVRTYEASESFCAPSTGIHRMEHERGAETIHVYAPADRRDRAVRGRRR